MKTLLFLSFFVLVVRVEKTAAQNYFFNTTEPYGWCANDVLTVQNGYISFTLTKGNNGNAYNLIKHDLQGQAIDSVFSSYSLSNLYTGFLSNMDSSNFVLAVNKYDSICDLKHTQSEITGYSNNLNLNWSTQIFDNEGFCTYAMYCQNNAVFVAGCSEVNNIPNSQETSLIKLDGNGNIMWKKKYPIIGSSSSLPSSLMCLSDGNIMISIVYRLTNSVEKIKLIKLDSVGNIIWETTLGQNDNFNHMVLDMEELHDQTLLLMCSKSQYSNTSHSGYLINMNLSAKVIWKRDYFSSMGGCLFGAYRNVLIEHTDGSLSALCSFLPPVTQSQTPLIIKFNPLGDTIWTKTYKTPSGFQYPCSFRQANEGYIMVGSSGFMNSTVYPQQSWYVKTDCNGAEGVLYPLKQPCYYYDCTQHPVYANFTSDKVYADTGEVIQFSNSSPNTTNRAWYFGDDSVAYTDANVQHAYSEYGTYQVKLITYHSMCSDTSVQTIQIGNTLGVSEYAQSSNGLKIYPNPSNGNFTVELENNKAATLSITDMLGKVIYTCHTTGTKTVCNSPTIAKGLYSLTIHYADGGVETKQIEVR